MLFKAGLSLVLDIAPFSSQKSKVWFRVKWNYGITLKASHDPKYAHNYVIPMFNNSKKKLHPMLRWKSSKNFSTARVMQKHLAASTGKGSILETFVLAHFDQ